MSVILAVVIWNTIACFFWVFQIVTAFLAYAYKKNSATRQHRNLSPPKLSVIIPAFNEPNERLVRTIFSVKNQKFVETEIIVIDDGSYKPITLDIPFIRLFPLPENRGKREAQIVGVSSSTYDWVVTVDSDTLLHPEALFNLYEVAIRENASAVTGTVYLSNRNENILTKATACMYWFAFFQERASQSYFGSTMCCSGALSIYKKDIVLAHKDQYLTQTFFGKKCIAGDDRHLTNIFLLNKEKVCWTPYAIAYTHSPSQIWKFVKQQMRWTRSHVAELWFQLSNIKDWSFIFAFLTCKLYFRYIYQLFIYALMIGYCLATWSLLPILYVLLAVMIVSAIKAGIAIIYTGDWSFVYLIIYGVLMFLVFNPMVFYGLMTPTKVDWSR